jgi:beta-fructofuranosidase
MSTHQHRFPQHCPIPRVADRFVNIYEPGPAIYTLPTATTPDGNITYTQGAVYPEWRTNDHTFIKGPDGRWHCFGITKPWVSGDNSHTGEGLCFHAVAPAGALTDAFAFHAWHDVPRIQVGDCGWAPAAFDLGNEYVLLGSHMGYATSPDLYTWKDRGRLAVKGGNRDPYILRLNDQYVMLRCENNGINAVVSDDFQTWSDPIAVYRPEVDTYHTESPVLIPYDGLYYLFWTLWDTADPSTAGFCPKTYVHCSESPFDFLGSTAITEITVHAPEIIQAEDGQWFISTTDHPYRGIGLAPLVWE